MGVCIERGDDLEEWDDEERIVKAECIIESNEPDRHQHQPAEEHHIEEPVAEDLDALHY